jgi:hypothetical protein
MRRLQAGRKRSYHGHSHGPPNFIKRIRESTVFAAQHERWFVSYIGAPSRNGPPHHIHRKKRFFALAWNHIPPALDHESRTLRALEDASALSCRAAPDKWRIRGKKARCGKGIIFYATSPFESTRPALHAR